MSLDVDMGYRERSESLMAVMKSNFGNQQSGNQKLNKSTFVNRSRKARVSLDQNAV